ncbi:MAG: YbfB/YjiJ family MFS transporter [Candidatus Eremiobacteraeota bacterium]|nr:YbfB/YjiJ family MFS transporter [Candidatus Eremiobacteraeota bacterium]
MRVGAAAACFAAIIGFSRLAYGALVEPMRRGLGGSYALYGTIGAANMAGYLLGTLLATRLARRPDRSRVNTIALALLCATMGASGFVRDSWQLGVLRVLVGIASGIALAFTLSLAVEGVTPARRGLAAAIVWAGGAAGIAIVGIAGLLAPLESSSAWRLQWIAMALAGAACTVIFARITGGPFAAREPADTSGAIGLFAANRYRALSIAYFLFGAGYIDVLTFLGAALAHTRTLPPAAAWIVLGTAGMVGAALWGPLVDRMRNGAPVAIACGCCTVGAFCVAFGATWSVLAGAVLIGVSFIGIPAMVGALVQQREAPERYARAFAGITLVLGVGQILGPVIGGAVADLFGAGAAILAGSAALTCAAAMALCYRPNAASLKITACRESSPKGTRLPSM